MGQRWSKKRVRHKICYKETDQEKPGKNASLFVKNAKNASPNASQTITRWSHINLIYFSDDFPRIKMMLKTQFPFLGSHDSFQFCIPSYYPKARAKFTKE